MMANHNEPEKTPRRVDQTTDAVRARSRRIAAVFLLSMLAIFGIAFFVIYMEDQRGMRREQEALERMLGPGPTGAAYTARGETSSPVIVTFDPNPFSMRDDAQAVDPQVAAQAMAEVRVGYQYLLAGELDWAESHARRALEIWKGMNAAQRMLGVIYIRRGQYDQAVVALEAALQGDPFNAETYNSLASIYLYRENMTKAEELLQSALNIRPNFLVAHYNLGLLYLVIERDELAIEHLEQSLQQFADEPGIYNNLGVAHMRLGQYEKAREYYRTGIARWPENPPPYFNMAISYVWDNQPDNAVQWLEKGAEQASPLDFQHYLEDDAFDPLKAHADYAPRIHAIYNSMMNVPE